MATMAKSSHITILGGGPAGLAVGFYARKQGLDFAVYEASDRVGGNCITLSHNGFRYDSGAHRFHAKDPEITADILRLMGERMPQIHVPSQIYSQGQLIDFPLTPLNLLRKLGLRQIVKAGSQLMGNQIHFKRATKESAPLDFEAITVQTYGRAIAERFLLNYSEKLWGEKPSKLSPEVAGKRLSGLNIKTFIKEAFQGNKAKTAHIDGSFYYPLLGIGEIFDQMAQFCGLENIHKQSAVTRIFHRHQRVTAVEINHEQVLEVGKESQVVSTLPLNLLLQMLEPTVPTDIIQLLQSICFQHLMLVSVFLNKPQITSNASLYFPDKEIIFTRVVEPRNRSSLMAPKGKTSLIAEIPYNESSDLWQWSSADFIKETQRHLVNTGLISQEEIVDATTYKINYAYPILDTAYADKITQIMRFLEPFQNLHLSGRGGKFVYGHIHDMMRYGKEIVRTIK